MLHKNFTELFIKRELEEIRGSSHKNVKILAAILMGTFLAIAISRGGLEYLRLKMDDPFVQNLEIAVPYSKALYVEDYKSTLNADTLKTKFKYDTVLSHIEYPLLFWNYSRNDYRRLKGRSIEKGNPLLKNILDKKNLIKGRSFNSDYDIGLIVTKKFIQDFGYKKDERFVQMAVAKFDEGYYKVPVPIIAVVKELPGLSSFAFTPYFYKVRNIGIDNAFNISKYRDINIFVPANDDDEITTLHEEVNNYLVDHEIYKDMDPYVEVYDYNNAMVNAKRFNITFYPEPYSQEETDAIYDSIFENVLKGFKTDEIYHIYNFDLPSDPYLQVAFDKISVVFNSLKNIAEFKDYLFTEFELDVEMSKIKDKENFTAISILTYIVALILFMFSLISLSFFIYNLIKSHLDKTKMNLGTFMAFGMSTRAISKIYRKIIRMYFLECMFYGFGSALIINLMIVLIFFPQLTIFQLISFHSLFAIFAITFIIEYVFKRGSKTILDSTPGDLIYGRK